MPPTLTAAELIKVVTQYGPAIEALIQFIELHRDEKVRALSMDAITQGLRYASQTGDATLINKAILEHCGATGCHVP